VPTQRITLKRCATVEGTIPGTVKLFHTGSAATITEDAPHYSVGERYLMLVRPFVDGSGKKTGEWVLPTPDARMLVDSSGEVHAITGHGKADRAYEGLNIAAPTDAGVARKVSKRDDVPTAKITISDGGGTGTRYWFSSGYWLHPASRTVPIYIAGSTSTQRSYVAAAAAEWDSKTVYALPRTSTLSTTKNLSYNIGNYGDSGWLGLAYGSYHWTATTARTNTYYSADSIERRGIACQEIGHTLGLDHYPGDCMGLGYFASASSYVRAATASDLNLKRNNDGH
jgi:hypothetical protein